MRTEYAIIEILTTLHKKKQDYISIIYNKYKNFLSNKNFEEKHIFPTCGITH